jgi:hypothetical protein
MPEYKVVSVMASRPKDAEDCLNDYVSSGWEFKDAVFILDKVWLVLTRASSFADSVVDSTKPKVEIIRKSKYVKPVLANE